MDLSAFQLMPESIPELLNPSCSLVPSIFQCDSSECCLEGGGKGLSTESKCKAGCLGHVRKSLGREVNSKSA